MYPCFISLFSLQIISTQRQEVDQGMEVLLSSNHQIEFCENVLEKLLINDAKSLVFFTRSECVETSRNLLKIFSPLIDELSSSRSQEAAQEPLTLVLPDTDAATVRVMLALLSRGEMPAHTELTHLKNVMRDVISLAACLGLATVSTRLRLRHQGKLRGTGRGVGLRMLNISLTYHSCDHINRCFQLSDEQQQERP